MTRPARSYIPRELAHAEIGNVDHGALTIAYLVRKRLQRSRRPIAFLLVDWNGRCFVATQEGATLAEVLREHPECLIGTYDERADAADIAADVEDFIREKTA